MIRISSIGSDGFVTVDARELFRVVAGMILLGELLELDEAEGLAAFYDGSHVSATATIVSYAELAQSASSC